MPVHKTNREVKVGVAVNLHKSTWFTRSLVTIVKLTQAVARHVVCTSTPGTSIAGQGAMKFVRHSNLVSHVIEEAIALLGSNVRTRVYISPSARV